LPAATQREALHGASALATRCRQYSAYAGKFPRRLIADDAADVAHSGAACYANAGALTVVMESEGSSYLLSMIFSENRHPPRIESAAGFFGIML
jgi:hypothetical protein